MALSKSKQQLAELLIAAGVKQFPERANWAAQCAEGEVSFWEDKPTKEIGCEWCGGNFLGRHANVTVSRKISNWHQTLLSRDEFGQRVEESIDINQYCESVTRSTPDQPTFDQLLQDWRDAADHAARKQDEVDEATAIRDQRWQAVQERAEAFGVSVASGVQQ